MSAEFRGASSEARALLPALSGGRRPLPVAVLTILAVFFALFPAPGSLFPVAHADGSAGIVVENGDGSIDTYCVAFSGNSITGPELLAKAGISVVQWNGAVCAIGSNPAQGCFQPHDFSSCYCKSYPPTNEYWSFFTQQNDQGWLYSAVGFASSVVHNGDMQAWKWGVGGPSSAPPPPEITFAQVCSAKAATPAPPPPTATTAPPTVQLITPMPTTAAPATVTPMTGIVPTRSSTASPTASPSLSTSPTTRITNHGSATATPALAASHHDGDGSSGTESLAAFAGVVAVIVAAIVVALLYRRRQHGR